MGGSIPQTSTSPAPREPALLPDPPAFFGSATRTIATARWTVPLLMTSWICALGMQGVLDATFAMIGLAVAGLAMGLGELWLKQRQAALVETAQALSRYAECTLGQDHELTCRARSILERARRDNLIAHDAGMGTQTEEILRYAWELVRVEHRAHR